MKNGKLCLLLIGILIISAGIASCGGGGSSSSSSSSSSSGGRQWTYMVYMGANNNLSDAGLYNLNDMEKVGSSGSLAIVVQAEFSPQYSAASGITQAVAGRIYVENDNNPNAVNLNAGTGIGYVDMATPAALTDFINWAKTNYPAQHYALVIWDHGGGWKTNKLRSPLKGAVLDDTSGNFMSLPDLAKGVADSNVHFDVINFDACLMAMYEVAYEFRGLTDYMVLSEQTEPGTGDPYDAILGALAANPSMTGRTLATTIVDKYNAFYVPDTREGTTKSAIDMSQIDALDAKVVALAKALTNETTATAAIQYAQNNTQNYEYTANHDLYEFCKSLNTNLSSGTSGTAKTLSGDIMTLMGSVVIDSKTTTSTVANSHGLAIYIPQANETNSAELAQYSQLKCNLTSRTSASGTWGSYINYLLAGSGGGTAVYKPGNFGIKITWTNYFSGQDCDADLDLYVWEPDVDFSTTGHGSLHAPYMGQTSPNGFFSQDSSVSGKSEEYYLANDQVLAGDYYFLVNDYASGPTCTRALARLYMYDPVNFGDSNWHEANLAGIGVNLSYPSPITLDLSSPWQGQALTSVADLNNYSDWWVPFSITKALTSSFPLGSNPPSVDKSSEYILRYKKGSRLLFGLGK